MIVIHIQFFLTAIERSDEGLRLVSSKNISPYFGIRVNFDINQDVNQLMYLVDVKIRLFGFICYFVNPFHVSSLLKKEDGTLFNIYSGHLNDVYVNAGDLVKKGDEGTHIHFL